MKNKIISILCIFILVSCLFINNQVFATDTTVEYTVPTEHIGDSPYFIYKLSNGMYYCWVFYEVSTTDNICLKTSEQQNRILVYNSTNDVLLSRAIKVYDSADGVNWKLLGTDSNGSQYSFDGVPAVLSCSNDFYGRNGDLLFQLPVQGMVLAQVLGKVEIQEPIITTIVGLAKLLIPLLICLLGFWKAWGVFSRLLHNA